MNLRVLHVIPSIAPRYGGPSTAIVEMCAALGRAGVDALVATTDADGSQQLPVELGHIRDFQNIRAIFFRRQFSESLKYSAPLSTWLHAHVAGFDIVHIHAVFSHACMAAASACRQCGVPYIVRPLGTLDPWSLRQKRLRKRLLWNVTVAGMLREAAAIHYTTASEQRLAEASLGLGRGVVIPIGVNQALIDNEDSTPTFRERFPQLGCNPYSLSLSRLHRKKGVERLLEAFAETVDIPEFAQWKLVIAGDGDPSYVSTLKNLAARIPKRSNEDRVLFTGWLDDEARIAALKDAAFFVLPSQQENFGLAVAEALAIGLPAIVSSDVGIAADIATHRAGVVVPLDAGQLSDALRRLMHDHELRREMGLAARRFAQAHFDWKRVAAQLVSLYADVRLHGHRPFGDLPPLAAVKVTRTT